MIGEAVTVLRRHRRYGRDEFNQPLYRWVETEVENVLVSPATTGIREDVTESNRPDGAIVSYTLHFPKTYQQDLTGAKIIVRGQKCRVIGHPDHYTLQNTPGEWSMPVEVETVDG